MLEIFHLVCVNGRGNAYEDVPLAQRNSECERTCTSPRFGHKWEPTIARVAERGEGGLTVLRMSRYRVLMACAIPSISGSGRARVSSRVCGPSADSDARNGCSSNNSAGALNKGHSSVGEISAPAPVTAHVPQRLGSRRAGSIAIQHQPSLRPSWRTTSVRIANGCGLVEVVVPPHPLPVLPRLGQESGNKMRVDAHRSRLPCRSARAGLSMLLDASDFIRQRFWCLRPGRPLRPSVASPRRNRSP